MRITKAHSYPSKEMASPLWRQIKGALADTASSVGIRQNLSSCKYVECNTVIFTARTDKICLAMVGMTADAERVRKQLEVRT